MAFTEIDMSTVSPNQASLANEYLLACRERLNAAGLSPGGYVDVYAGLEGYQESGGFFRDVQDFFTYNCHCFVQSHDLDGSPRSEGFYDKDTITMWSWENLKLASGLTSGFRRAVEWPEDWTDYSDPAFSYGSPEKGDLIGPWLWEDFRILFPFIVWTKRVPTWTGLTEGYKSGQGDDPVLATAKSLAEADFAGASPGPSSEAYCYAEIQAVDWPWYVCFCSRSKAKGLVSGVYTGVLCDIDWYVLASSTGVFDANGDLVEDGVWRCWKTESNVNATETVVSSTPLSSFDQPNWPDVPGWDTYTSGWYAVSAAAVLRWHFTDLS